MYFPQQPSLFRTSRSPAHPRSLYQSQHLLAASSFSPYPAAPVQPESLSSLPASVDLLDFSDDLLLEDGQDGIVFAYLLEHHSAVKLIAHFLEIIPRMW